LKTTQGRVVQVNSDHLVVELEAGFPSLHQFPRGIVDNTKTHGRKIRKYRVPAGKVPRYQRIDPAVPGGPKWHHANKFHPNDAADRRWRVYFDNDADVNSFAYNDLVGFKSKHGGQAYKFLNASHITFDSVMWTHETRGVFKGSNNITVKNSRAGPDPWIDNHFTNVQLSRGNWGRRTGVQQYLASSSGGPQIGSPPDNPINWNHLPNRPATVFAENGGSHHRLMNNVFTRLGDDPIGLFNVEKNVVVRNNTITDGPARGVLNFNVCKFFNHVAVRDNTLNNTWVRNLPFYPKALIGNWSAEVRQPWCQEWWQKIWR